MPEYQFITWLDEATYIAVEYLTVRGQVVLFVVRLVLVENDRELNVARYDTAHGAPHRDLLTRSGRVCQKDWMLGHSFDEALDLAIRDFKGNYEEYIKKFRES